MKRSEIYLQSVSDAVIAWSPVHITSGADLSKAMNSLWGVLSATSGVMLLSLSMRHSVRGGIEVDGGTRIYPEGTEIYGRALNSAYELETTVARYPRVVIGAGLVRFLSEVSTIDGPPEEARSLAYARDMVQRCQQLITTDCDGQQIIHWLGPAAREQYQSVKATPLTATREVIGRVRTFINESMVRFQSDTKLGPRYTELETYFDRYSGEWLK